MAAYYNEIDPYAAQWLRNLIADGQIAPGDVDERSIEDVKPDDLRGYTQAHFFAGIGGWSIALRLAGWHDERPVWTGSCPCQPFSAAGKGKAADDERHLWPAWFSLISECRPGAIFGEQVEAAIGWGWLDAVFNDLEAEGYACGAAVLPACSVGAPHIRQRLWFMGYASGEPSERGTGGISGTQAQERSENRTFNGHSDFGLADAGEAGGLADTRKPGPQGRLDEFRECARNSWEASDWSAIEWLQCSDGKARPTKPGLFCLAHGVQRRAHKLRAYGNAIVPQVAAEFIKAGMHNGG